MGTIGDAPGAARFLELGADMKMVLEDGRFLRSGEIGFRVDWLLSMPNPVGYDFGGGVLGGVCRLGSSRFHAMIAWKGL
jgi:hypothetical protein